MGKYSISKEHTIEGSTITSLNNIANELAEMNRLKRLELGLKLEDPDSEELEDKA